MHTLYVMNCGELSWKDPATGSMVRHPVPAYLIETAAGRLVLVDSGNPATLIGKPTAAPWFEAPIRVRAEDDLAARLKELKVRPTDISLIVSTHFDFDHCGRHDLFDNTGVESLVQEAMLEHARHSDRYDSCLWNRPGLRHVTVAGDHEIEPGLLVLRTDGHAVGHQSVFVETEHGPVVLAVDAIAEVSALGPGPLPPFYMEDAATARASQRRLRKLAEESDAYVVYGHDAGQWKDLALSPAPFVRPAMPNTQSI